MRRTDCNPSLTKIKVRQFQQQQLQQFDALLANYNWSSVFNTSGIEDSEWSDDNGSLYWASDG